MDAERPQRIPDLIGAAAGEQADRLLLQLLEERRLLDLRDRRGLEPRADLVQLGLPLLEPVPDGLTFLDLIQQPRSTTVCSFFCSRSRDARSPALSACSRFHASARRLVSSSRWRVYRSSFSFPWTDWRTKSSRRSAGTPRLLVHSSPRLCLLQRYAVFNQAHRPLAGSAPRDLVEQVLGAKAEVDGHGADLLSVLALTARTFSQSWSETILRCGTGVTTHRCSGTSSRVSLPARGHGAIPAVHQLALVDPVRDDAPDLLLAPRAPARAWDLRPVELRGGLAVPEALERQLEDDMRFMPASKESKARTGVNGPRFARRGS